MMPIVHHSTQNQIKPQKPQNFETQNLYNTILFAQFESTKTTSKCFKIKIFEQYMTMRLTHNTPKAKSED
jgi:hypothetical protein